MKRKALVVGINRYPFLKESNKSRHLTTSARDADAIARMLEVYGSFEVQRLPTSQDEWEFDPKGLVKVESLKAAITQLFQPTESNIPDTGLLFFAGIGLRQDADNGEKAEVFMATSDASPRKNIWGISLRWLCQLLEDSPVPQQVIWLDCSHSGQLLKLTHNQAGNGTQVKDRCLIAASRETESAYARDGRGLLSNELLKCLNPQLRSEAVVTNYTLAESFPEEFEVSEEKASQHPVVRNTGNRIALTSKLKFSKRFPGTGHPLDQLWEQTREWFAKSDDKSCPLVELHNSAKVAEYFGENSKDIERANQYKEAVQTAFRFTFPQTWWEEKKSVFNLHEALKCLCGSYFCGNTVYSSQKRSISIGAAYLIALIAHYEIWEDVAPLTDQVTTWVECPKVTSKLFPSQDSLLAQSSTKALYYLFYHLFEDRNSKGKSPVRNTLLEKPGHRLKIQLEWNAQTKDNNRDKTLAQEIYQIVQSSKIEVPKSAENTRSAILRLWMYMLASEEGFMSPGVVYMEGDKLVVAAVQS